MLKSRRLPKHNVEETIKFMGNDMPSRRQIDNAEAGGEPLTPEQKLCRIVLPVLLAHLQGEFRWCAYCLKLTPDENLNRCGGCNQVGYCALPEDTDPHVLKHMHHPTRDAFLAQVPCHEAHWKAGHKKECKRFQAEAAERRKAEENADETGPGWGGLRLVLDI